LSRLNERKSGLFGSFLLSVDRVHCQAGENQYSSSPLSTGKLITKVEDGCHNCKEFPRCRNDRAWQSTVVGNHSKNEELEISKILSSYFDHFKKNEININYLSECAGDGKSSQIPQDERMSADEPGKVKHFSSYQKS
jgi:hypothetical protein